MSTKRLPGIVKLDYIAVENLTLYPKKFLSAGSTTAAIGNFTNLPLVGLAAFSYSNERTDNGTLYNTRITGMLLDDSTIGESRRETLIEKFHCYRATDVYGNRYLVGIDKDPYPEIVFSPVIDGSPSGVRAINFELTWRSTLPPVEILNL